MYFIADLTNITFSRKVGSKNKTRKYNPLKAALITGGLVAATPTMIGLMDKDINKLSSVPLKYKAAALGLGGATAAVVGLDTLRLQRKQQKNK